MSEKRLTKRIYCATISESARTGRPREVNHISGVLQTYNMAHGAIQHGGYLNMEQAFLT